METIRSGLDEVTRLHAVQARVRTLVRENDCLGDAIRGAFDGYRKLCKQHSDEKSALKNRLQRLQRELLEQGWLSDPATKLISQCPCFRESVEGLCPIILAERLEAYQRRDALPLELEREGAAAALAALNRRIVYDSRDTPSEQQDVMAAGYRAALEAKTHVEFRWEIVVLRPNDWKEPPNPGSLDRADLEQLSDADFHTISLHCLGGLADVGALRPIVPKPVDTGDKCHDAISYMDWLFRLPIDRDDRDEEQPPLNVRAFPPDVAEQMLEHVEKWISDGCPKSAEARLLPLNPSERAFLRALSESTGPLFGIDLATKAGYSEYRGPLNKLVRLGFAKKVGERKGYESTAAGIEHLRGLQGG